MEVVLCGGIKRVKQADGLRKLTASKGRTSSLSIVWCFFFFNDPAPTEFYPFSLHDALPISIRIPARPAPGHSPRAGYPRWWGGPSAHGFADAISAGADR